MARKIVVIFENLPEDLPVREAEIAVVERYLNDIVDEILAEIERARSSGQKCLSTPDRTLGKDDEPDHGKCKYRRWRSDPARCSLCAGLDWAAGRARSLYSGSDRPNESLVW
jgi:hypothetical protein